MRRYSQFLTANPSILGLNPYDLVLIVTIVQSSFLFNWPALFTLVFCPISILLGKLIQKYFDVTGFLLGFRRTDTLSLYELRKQVEETRK